MSIYDTLNDKQKEAVFTTEGPVLILAGAGSGKTRALTHRIAYLIEQKQVAPWNILAITFTNKAAAEMRERVNKLVGDDADNIWVSTFHSMCVRILRKYIEGLGFTTKFSIYDTDDQKTLMRQVLKKLEMDPKIYKEKTILSAISSYKDRLISPDEAAVRAAGDYRKMKEAEAYRYYQSQLKQNNALDFDDIIVKTIELLENDSAVRGYYQERFKYILVDEYQDTNYAQFKLVSILADKYKNLCVVGDDDQSIYKFRGADIENILGFERVYPSAKVIKLEQNYRSTTSILDAANEVIRHNYGRKSKRLWTANEEGLRVKFCQYDSAEEEASNIVREIKERVQDGSNYSDFAVLYRTNAQSRLIEEKCVKMNVPYQLIGGVNFYQRKEIKDMLAYLKTIDNGLDDLSVKRIINVPKRGIGATSEGKVDLYAEANRISFYEACTRASNVPGIGKAAEKFKAFTELISQFKAFAGTESVADLIEEVLHKTGYITDLRENSDEVEMQTRLENIGELRNKAADYCNKNEDATLSGFLEEVALIADIDNMDDSDEKVVLMTLHGAKGLEFPIVYLAGMEDGLFPSMMSINSGDPSDIEEERRLCYVGITRAQKELTLTAAKLRMVNGETRFSKVSRFVEEIPQEMLDEKRIRSVYSSGYGTGSKRFSSDYDDDSYEGRGYGRKKGSSGGYGSSYDDDSYANRLSRKGSAGGYNSGYSSGYASSGYNSGYFSAGTGSSGYGSTGDAGYGTGSAGYGAGGLGYGAGDSCYGSNTGYSSYGKGFSTSKYNGRPDFDNKNRMSGIMRGSDFAAAKADKLEYEVNDRVKHMKFGEGTVLSIVEQKKDFEVTVDFDNAGVKKMYAAFAKLKKID